MFQAVWNGAVLAQSDQTVNVDGDQEAASACCRADDRGGR
jgi:hypothetical protein